jgi:hypothetical protein
MAIICDTTMSPSKLELPDGTKVRGIQPPPVASMPRPAMFARKSHQLLPGSPHLSHVSQA